MHPLAKELNDQLEGTAAGRLLSKRGRRLYFPRGIIAQSAEAKAKAHYANATIGIAMNQGRPLILSGVQDSLPGLSPEEAVAYAPTAGVEKTRRAWKDLILQKNPRLHPDRISLPVVVPGLTAGLSYLGDLFLDEGQRILANTPAWDNYSLIFEERLGGVLRGIPFFGPPGRKPSQGLDLDTIARGIREEASTGAVRLILNFPHNPSGYSPTAAEAEALGSLILQAAKTADVLVICDDAYFGLFYEEGLYKASLFNLLADLHERVLAVKVDGPIKEDYVWGFRTGFVTFASKGLGEGHHGALIRKLMGAIRSSVSCANTPSQHIILKIMEDPRTGPEKDQFQGMLRGRYERVKEFITGREEHPFLKPLPFNSGYFMSFRCEGISPEALRQELLQRHGIGTVALGEDCLRIAFACLDEEKIPLVYQTIYDTALRMGAE